MTAAPLGDHLTSAGAGQAPATTEHTTAAVVPGVIAPGAQRCAPIWPSPIPTDPQAGSPDPLWWWLGAHGGAGVSFLTTVVTASGDARGRWPGGYPQECPNVVLVARTHVEGLEAARDLAAQHGAGLLPPGVRLLGLVTVADAPGRLPTRQRRLRDLVSATVPHAWHLPWVEEWRGVRRGDLPFFDPEHPDPDVDLRAKGSEVPSALVDCAEALTAAAVADF